MTGLLFLLPFLVLVLIVAALCIAHAAEVHERGQVDHVIAIGSTASPVARVLRPFSMISVADAFEPDTAVLWETQISALERISAAGDRGVARDSLLGVYVRSARKYPELYEGSEFQGWLRFLEEAQLIVMRSGTVTITPAGVEFLKCRVPTKAAA